jgi:hypothetical protein
MREGKRTGLFAPLAGAVITAVFATSAHGIVIDGTLDSGYGSALSTQKVDTSFGNATGGDAANGSELDAAYGVIQGTNLDLFFAGDFENNGNHLNVFVSGGAAGQSILSTSGGTLATMNGSAFSPGFQATYAYDMNDYGGTLYCEEYTYAGVSLLSGGYLGSLSETSTGIGAGSPGGTALLGINNTHVSTMSPTGGAATNQAAADAVTTGFEMQIPLSSIGYTGGNVEVLADINGGGDGYLSNQFLPGLAVGSGSLGTSSFNFASTPGAYFTVAVPEPGSLLTVGLSAMALLRRRPRQVI